MASKLDIPWGVKSDTTWTHGWWRERATFSVPKGTPLERVLFHAQKYMVRFGEALESQGYTVLKMTLPQIDKREAPPIPPDRDRYKMIAWVQRRPIEQRLWVPDVAVPAMERLGYRPLE